MDPAPALYTSSFDGNVGLRWLVGVARGSLWRGVRLEEISQIGLKPALATRSMPC